jgi:HEAT repeat protein
MKKNMTFSFVNNNLLTFFIANLVCLTPFQTVFAQEKGVPALIEDLNHEDDRIRRDAAMYLSELAGAKGEVVEAIPALVKALGDSQQQVWFHSITALSKLGPDAAPAIPELINDLREMRRRSVNAKWYRSAYALGQIGEAAVEPLLIACGHQRSSVRAGAAKAMEWIPEASAQTVPVLIKLLEDEDEDVREISAESLSVLPEPALKLLTEAIHHESGETRKVVYMALGKTGLRARMASQILLERIRLEEDSELLAFGIDALSKMGANQASFFTFLMNHFKHEENQVQQSIANAILSLPPAKTVPTLIGYLASEDENVQSRAASLLGNIGPPAAPALTVLIDIIEQTKANTSQGDAFKSAYVSIGLKGIPALLDHIAQLESNSASHWATDLLASYGMIGVSSLEKALEKNNTKQILAVMNAFALMGSVAIEAEGNIVRMTRHESAPIRAAAVQALTSIGIKPVKLSPLIEPLLNDRNLSVRQSAVASLRKSPEAAVEQLDKLNDLLNDSDPGTRENALLAIASTGNQANELAEEVAMLLADSTSAVQKAAINTLGSIGTAPDLALRQMDWLARHDNETMLLSVLQAMSRMGDRPVAYLSLFESNLDHAEDGIREAAFSGYTSIEKNKEKLLSVMINAIGDETVAIRHSSLKAMGSMREDAAAAIPHLIARLDHDEDQDLALGALRFMPSKIEFIGDYMASLEHDDPGVRQFGCRALGRMGKDAISALPKLKEARRDRYRFVRDEANKAIQRIED